MVTSYADFITGLMLAIVLSVSIAEMNGPCISIATSLTNAATSSP